MLNASTAIALPIENFTNRIEMGLELYIESLADLDHDDLLAVRGDARALARFGWRLECAADAELVRRFDPHEKVSGRRSAQSVRQLCAETGESARTIYRNAQIHRTFFTTATSGTQYANLEDKSFYIAALESPDPTVALEYFSVQKAQDSSYSPMQALQHIRGRKMLEPDVEVPMFLETPDQREAFDEWVRTTKKLLAIVPRWKWLSGWIEEAMHEATRPSDTWRERILEKISVGFNSVDLLAGELAIDRTRMQVLLNRLADDGTIKALEPERVPGSRGPIKIVYVINRV